MPEILLGIIAIVAGMVLCFRGLFAMRAAISVWGGFVGFALGTALASLATRTPPLSGPVGWIAAIAGAVLLAWASYAFYAVGVLATMGSIGFALGGAVPGLVGASGSLQTMAGVAGAVILVVVALATNLPELLLIVVSAAGGASVIVHGFHLLLGQVRLSAATVATLTWMRSPVWCLNVLFVVLFVSGLVVQLRRRSHANVRAAYQGLERS